MENRSDDILAAENASIISIILFMLVGEKTSPQGSKIDLLEHYIKSLEWDGKPYYNHNTKQVLKLMRGSYNAWKSRVFRKEDKYPELGVIRKRTEILAKSCSKEFTDFKNVVVSFLADNDCYGNEAISYACCITTLVRMGNSYLSASMALEITNKAKRAEYRTLSIIKDDNFEHNCKKIFPLIYTPTDINVNDSKEINDAASVLIEKVYQLYCKNFY